MSELNTKEVPKKSKGLRIFFIIIVFLIILSTALITVGVVYVKKNFNYKYNEITEEPEELGFEEVINDNIVNIALFGVDTRNQSTFTGRSDSIMILSINTTDKKIKIISVMRDSLVPITKANGRTNFSKINNAYATGGPELAIKTLNSLFALDISEYATVNFNGMMDIIDAVGGIEIDVTQAEIDVINANASKQAERYGGSPSDYIMKSAGLVHMNGMQAVEFSRIRYVTSADGAVGDYGRTDRQRVVMRQLFDKATKMDKFKYISLIKALSPCCETSISYTEALDLAVSVLLSSPTFEETRIPSTDYTMRSPSGKFGSVVYYDLEFAANIIHAFIYDDITPENYILQNGILKNDWYNNGYNPPIIKSNEQQVTE